MAIYAVVLRGIICGRARGRRRTVGAVANVLGNLFDRVIAPLAQSSPQAIVHVYVCTYAFDALGALEHQMQMIIDHYGDDIRKRIVMKQTCVYERSIAHGSQLYAMREALRHVAAQSHATDYGAYLIMRPDTQWKRNITDIVADLDKLENVTYLFPERTTLLRKNSEDFVSDVFFAVPARKLPTEFMPALEMHDVSADLHGIYESAKRAAMRARRAAPTWNACIDQRFDSNTDNMQNPFYEIQRSMSSYNTS